jgi:hypothetical protein
MTRTYYLDHASREVFFPLTEPQQRAYDTWVESVQWHARHDGRLRLVEARDLVGQRIAGVTAYQLDQAPAGEPKPDRWVTYPTSHFCPGYYDCLACYPD